MCYQPTARPPLPPIAGGSGLAGSEEVVLQSADGTRFATFSARTDHQGAPGVAILPDVRGLHPFYRDLAVRFAEAGANAAALDYFGRTAGTDTSGRDADFDYRPHVDKTTPDQVAMDAAATAEFLRSEAGGGSGPVYTVGFCFGGRHSFNQAARGHGLAGVIGFYGRPQRRSPDDDDAPVDRVGDFRCPVLGLFGGADTAIPTEGVDGFRQALDAAGVVNEMVIYPGAPHSFFDRNAAEHAEAGTDAWRRMLAFIGRPAAG
jgi:carboxymethylenebutenolidase